MILAVITQSTFALIVNPIKRTCSFVMWAPHTLNHGHATHFHNYKSPHTLTFAQTAQTPKTTLNNLQLKTHSWHCCVAHLSVCVCCPHHVCLLFSQWLPLKEAREGGKRGRSEWGSETEMKKMRRTLGIHCNKINILSLASHGRHTLFYYTHTRWLQSKYV